MSRKALVEVLLATYNCEKYLSEQIDSILSQDYKNFHLLIKDDCSTDRTCEIIRRKIEEYPGKITLIASVKNRGVVGNFSDLMQHVRADADYIMFSDHDDVWLSHKISQTLKTMKLLESKQGFDLPLLVHTDLQVVSEDLQLKHLSFWKYAKLSPQKGSKFNRLLAQNVVTGCTMMINRPLLMFVSSIPQEALMHDWWLALIAAAFGHIECISESTLLYRQHGNNCLGAQRMGLYYELKKWLAAPRKYLERRRLLGESQKKQALAFLEFYGKELAKIHRDALLVYSQMDPTAFFQKARNMIRYGFYKQGFLRNFGDLFLCFFL